MTAEVDFSLAMSTIRRVESLWDLYRMVNFTALEEPQEFTRESQATSIGLIIKFLQTNEDC